MMDDVYEVRSHTPHDPVIREDPRASFLRRVRVETQEHQGAACWAWLGDRDRYDVPMLGGCEALTVAWRVFIKPEPLGQSPVTTCPTRDCVNPAHARLTGAGAA